MNFFEGKLVKEGNNLVVDLESFKVKVPKERQAIYEGLVDQEVIFGIRQKISTILNLPRHPSSLNR